MASVYSVSQVNAYIKNMFLQDFALSRISVRGEVSNCKYHTSGHIYFTLKDGNSAISAVMFAGSRSGLSFKLQEGQRVVADGSIDVYERDGRYQLYAKKITLDGTGDLFLRFQKLRDELEEMGMFAREYKQPIPRYAMTVGIVTASTGAAIRDIINIARRRNPYVQLVLCPAQVQGEQAKYSIVRGIETLDALGLDVMIVGRGGGSIEMIHTSSLIHDDLPCMDNDTLRRGKPTAWVKYGYDMAVLAGDGLMIYAFETAAKALALGADPARTARSMQILAEKTGIYGMIGGQTVDVELTNQPIPEEKLDFIYRLKTGALLEASLMIGAVMAGASEDEVKKMEEVASLVGVAFQIQDDILDVTGSEEELGKPVLSDEKNNKTTYVTLKGLEKAKADEEEISRRAVQLLCSLEGDHEFLEELINMLTKRRK